MNDRGAKSRPPGEANEDHQTSVKRLSAMSNSKSSSKSQDDSLAFLKKLRPGGPWVLTAIVPDGLTTTITAQTVGDAETFIRKYDGKRNLYYSVNPTRTAVSKKAAKTDIAAIEYALADLDPADGETSKAAKARYLKQLEHVRAQAHRGRRQRQRHPRFMEAEGTHCPWRTGRRKILGPRIKPRSTTSKRASRR